MTSGKSHTKKSAKKGKPVTKVIEFALSTNKETSKSHVLSANKPKSAFAKKGEALGNDRQYP